MNNPNKQIQDAIVKVLQQNGEKTSVSVSFGSNEVNIGYWPEVNTDTFYSPEQINICSQFIKKESSSTVKEKILVLGVNFDAQKYKAKFPGYSFELVSKIKNVPNRNCPLYIQSDITKIDDFIGFAELSESTLAGRKIVYDETNRFYYDPIQ